MSNVTLNKDAVIEKAAQSIFGNLAVKVSTKEAVKEIAEVVESSSAATDADEVAESITTEDTPAAVVSNPIVDLAMLGLNSLNANVLTELKALGLSAKHDDSAEILNLYNTDELKKIHWGQLISITSSTNANMVVAVRLGIDKYRRVRLGLILNGSQKISVLQKISASELAQLIANSIKDLILKMFF